MSKRTLRCIVLALLSTGCGGASRSFDSPLEARIEFLKSAHPSLNRTLSADRLDALTTESLSLEHQHALGEVRVLRRILAALGDSHLTSELPSPADNEATFAPFLVKRVGTRFRVDAAVDETLVGHTVLAIEGVAIDELMARLSELANVDGARSDVQLAEAERKFAEFIRLELGPRASWTLTVEVPESESRTETLAGASIDGVRALYLGRRSTPVWGQQTALPNVSQGDEFTLLRLASFGTPDRAGYLRTIEELAEQFTGASHLVIDLRGNEGGDRSLGVAVARHLVGRPFSQWHSVRTRVRDIAEPFDEWVSFIVGSPSALTEFPGERTDRGWVVEGDPLSETMLPHGAEFAGRITLFVDDATNSAAIEFAVSLLAYHPRVTVVGRETQGECAWHVGHLPVLFNDNQGPALLASLFEIELVAYPGCRERRGIEPDLAVTYTEADFMNGVDPYVRVLQEKAE
ncbi:MAG: S41 family peptidase [Myxococcota bacterium]